MLVLSFAVQKNCLRMYAYLSYYQNLKSKHWKINFSIPSMFVLKSMIEILFHFKIRMENKTLFNFIHFINSTFNLK